MMTESEEFWELADRIAAVMTDAPVTPSTLGRKAHVTTPQAAEVLRWMVRNHYVTTVGNGSWARYRVRRFGEP